MEEARVLGTVIATRAVDSLRGRKLVWVVPLDEEGKESGPPLVAVDTTQSGRGGHVFFVRGREAAQALDDPFCPVDAAVIGIVDESRTLPPGGDGIS